MYDVQEVARYIISYARQEKIILSNLKLQKVLYMIWIEYYKDNGEYLFNEQFCAWKIGPTIPKIFYEYCIFAGNNLGNFPWETFSSTPLLNLSFLISFLETWLNKPMYLLNKLSLREEGAWQSIWNNGKGTRQPIPYNLIIEKDTYFLNI